MKRGRSGFWRRFAYVEGKLQVEKWKVGESRCWESQKKSALWGLGCKLETGASDKKKENSSICL